MHAKQEGGKNLLLGSQAATAKALLHRLVSRHALKNLTIVTCTHTYCICWLQM